MRLTPLYLVLLLLPLAAWADPMGSVEGGGTVRLLAEHPTVSLNTERLVFEPATRFTRITANLEMENHGEAASVPMGFPVPMWHPGSGQDMVNGFSVTVDGTALEVTEAPRAPLLLTHQKPYCRWYKFTVPFAARQKRQMVVTYDVRTPASPQVGYILATGGTWRDTIRSFELEVKLGERLNYHELKLTGDGAALPCQRRDGSLVWRCTDYNGKPEVIWFAAKHGPATVLLDGEKLWPAVQRRVLAGDVPTPSYNLPAVWHGGKLLVSADLLANLLMTSQRRPEPVEGEWQPREFSRQGVTCELKGLKFPLPPHAEREPLELYVDPAPALALGGAISHRVNAAGDLEISLTSVPESVPVARKLAATTDVDANWRLRCLRYLARHDRAALSDVAHEVARLPHEDWTVLAALVGYTADDPPPAMTPQMALERQKLVNTNGTAINPADRVGIIIRLGQTQDDNVIRGAGLVLAALDGPGAQQQVLEDLLARDGGHAVSPGLLLCALNQPATAQKLVDALRPCTNRSKLTNGCLALGYLGDDAGIPFLQSVIRGHAPANDGVIDAASQALALMGTRQSIEACAAMLTEASDSKWVPRNLLRGLQRAAGVQPEYGYYYYATRPEWAQSLSAAEAKAVVLPLAQELKGKLPAGYGKDLDEIMACCEK